MPKVSVIVPMYNSARYLKRCVDSLINQTLKDIEIILVNDASPDSSLEIAREYELVDNRIKVIDSPVNIVASRNLGIKIATGDYLGFVDADDWVDDDFYERLYNSTMYGKVDVVIGSIKDVYDNINESIEATIPKNILSNQFKTKEYVTLNGGRLFTNIWKRDLITDDLLFIENNFYCDSIVYLWYLKAKTFAKVDEVYYNYSINTSSITHLKDNPRIFDRLYSAVDMLERSKFIGLYEKYHQMIDYRFYVLYFKNSLLQFCVSFRKLPWKVIRDCVCTIKSEININKNIYYNKESLSIGMFLSKSTLCCGYIGFFFLLLVNSMLKLKYLVKKI